MVPRHMMKPQQVFFGTGIQTIELSVQRSAVLGNGIASEAGPIEPETD